MSLETQLSGVKKAIDSPKTPQHLKKALAQRATDLQKELDRRKKRPRGIWGKLGF
jgi:hypothetical protein